MTDALRDVTFVTTCQRRLHYLERTMPSWVRDGADVILVDWHDPHRSATWAEEWIRRNYLTTRSRRSGVQVLRAPEDTGHGWHKTAALNLASDAMADGVVLYIDADVCLRQAEVAPAFDVGASSIAALQAAIDAVERKAHAPVAYVADPRGNPDLTGLLLVRHLDIVRVGGWDEAYHGRGYEDLDMRVRLWEAGVRFEVLPDVFEALPNPDHERDRSSEDRNAARLAKTVLRAAFPAEYRRGEPLSVPRLKQLAEDDPSLMLALGAYR